jgi:hypothetical protein
MTLDVLKDFPAAAGAVGSGDAFLVTIYAIISMFVLVGIAHLFSRILRNQKLGDWAKDEFVQAVISAAIVGSLYILMAPQSGVIIQAFDSLIPSGTQIPVWNSIVVSSIGQGALPVLGGGAGIVYEDVNSSDDACGDMANTPLCYAYDYLALLQESITGLSMDMLAFTSMVGILASLSVNLIVVDIAPLSGLTSVVTICNSVMQSMIFLGVVAGVEMALLVFIGATALNVFLPIGVVLRCFFATRRIGGLLMAVAIGLYIVFPLTIALNAIAMNSGQDAQLSQDSSNFLALESEVDNISPFSSSNLSSYDQLTGFATTADAGLGPVLAGVRSVPVLSTDVLSSMVVQLVFLPVLSVMITALAIKELAGLFGSEINLSRFEV